MTAVDEMAEILQVCTQCYSGNEAEITDGRLFNVNGMNPVDGGILYTLLTVIRACFENLSRNQRIL